MSIDIVYPKPVTVVVYNIFGQKIVQYSPVSNGVILLKKDFSPGIYAINILDGNRLIGQQKIIWE